MPFRFAPRAALLALPVVLAAACSTEKSPPHLVRDSGIPYVGPKTGPCTSWETNECGIELGRSGDVVQCAKGHQTCENGMWGPCLADAALGIQSVRIPGSGWGSWNPQVVGNPPAACTNNPCSPACQTFVDTTDGGVTTTTPDASNIIGGGSLSGSNVPSGFQKKGSDENKDCTPGCTSVACQTACQYDQKCSTTTAKECEAFTPTESGGCNGVDYTLGVGCQGANGERIFAMCNRGTTTAPAGANCYTFPGNSQQMPNSSPSLANATVILTTTQTIDPGRCVTQTLASNLFDNNGAQEVWCSAPAATTECNPYNNWSATKGSPAYVCSVIQQGPPVAATETRVFQAVCPAESGPVWVNFGYTTSTPAGANVEFRFRSFQSTNGVCTPLAPVTADPPTPAATASTTQDPQVCPIGGGVNGCPKPLETYLDFPEATYDCLQMDARLNPSSTAGPVLYDWTVNYDCRANR